MSRESITRLQLCPNCGYPIDRATHAIDEDATPSKGDVSVCIDCGTALIFRDDDLTLAIATADDLKALPPDVAMLLLKMLLAWDKEIRPKRLEREASRTKQ